MTQEDSKKIFEYVKKDDLTSFCSLIKSNNDLNISFGRFPLLTTCYLYNSNKIIKKFFKKLAKVKNFESFAEPFEIYLKFKNVSKKSLRLYAGKQNIVMPIEMLAILNKDVLVKKYYKIMAKSPKTDEFLQKIYNFNGQNVKIDKNKIKISHKKISKKAKVWLIASHSALAFCAGIIAVVLVLISNAYGLGTLHSPKKITDAQSFERLAGKGSYATLLDDLVLDEKCSLKNFYGTIFGNGKTITINYDYDSSLIDSLNGKIQDVNIIFVKGIDKSIETDLCLLTNTNNGGILNVNITVNQTIKLAIDGPSSNFSGFAITNNKYIHDCSIKFALEANSTNTSDNFASFVAINNNGIISGCEVLEGSSIKTTNVDIAGIANQNNTNAEISTCRNKATLFQSTTSNTWSPNVAGIANSNFGTISNCLNHGNLTADDNATNKSNNGVFVGGICSQNFSIIRHSKNLGNINSTSDITTIYAGGITAYTGQQENSNPSINFCGSTGNFDITKNSDEVFMYCGGISGFMIGSISDCYTTATYNQNYSEEKKNMIALMIGASSGQAFYGIQVYLDIGNIHCLSVEGTTKTLAIVYSNMGYTYIENLSADITIHDTKQEIENTSIYW